ncbi:H/ACA ribonucleoprotein complex non-core subunit NAF1 [Sceloporus undulatus]|uniref:H/ACA ribonucleoprotein complex non-core subunit NAF1 n=1 Tax=Sceloporus undulatus TaxID=8520 RepID=UPI001C4AE204|nr:H/ACA ribonucleoprotein complex non-core subunit NAF1 [Sceloporus undulatus]
MEEPEASEAAVNGLQLQTLSVAGGEAEAEAPSGPGLLATEGSNEGEPLGPSPPVKEEEKEGPSLLGDGGEGGEPGPGPAEEPQHSPLQEEPTPAAPAPSPSLEADGPSERMSPVAPEEEEEESSSSSSASSSESDSESESDTDTDSSSSDSSSSSCLPMLSEDDVDQQNKNEDNCCSTTKNGEMAKQEPLCVEDVTIILPESVELMPFGKISSIIGHLVIVESQKGLPPVNEDTVLFKDDRRSVGKIFEVFGPVSHPFYVLQFNSPEHIESKDIKVHDAMYFAPSVESFTQYIFPEKIKPEKGSDASWMNDSEPPPEALEFSDDEKERAAKQQKKSQKLRRKKLRSLEDYNKYDDNGIYYHPGQQQHSSDYSEGYCKREPHPTFSNRRFPHPSPPPHFFRPQASTPQHYSYHYAEPWKPSEFCQQQRPENLIIHQHSFPPPLFETVNNQANFPPPQPSVTWGWSPGYTQNICDPLLSLLSLPPPPPPPLPPP